MRRHSNIYSMPVIPESTKTSLAQRLSAHAKANWPQLAEVHLSSAAVERASR